MTHRFPFKAVLGVNFVFVEKSDWCPHDFLLECKLFLAIEPMRSCHMVPYVFPSREFEGDLAVSHLLPLLKDRVYPFFMRFLSFFEKTELQGTCVELWG